MWWFRKAARWFLHMGILCRERCPALPKAAVAGSPQQQNSTQGQVILHKSSSPQDEGKNSQRPHATAKEDDVTT